MNTDIAAPVGSLAAVRCSPQPHQPASRARLAASTLFLVDGMTFGTWAALIPSFQQKFALSEGKLSWVLLGLVIGALCSMPLAGRLIARWGSRRVGYVSAVFFVGSLPLLGLAPNYELLIAAAVLFGAWKGALDVSVNAQGVTVEKAAHKPIFSSFQAFWSLGGLSAAFLLSIALNHGYSPTVLMGGMAVLLLAMVVSTFGKLLPETPEPVAEQSATANAAPRKTTLLFLGGLAFLALFSEGVLLDWSAVYARSVVQVSVAQAPIAFAVFALCMAAGRFLGDALIVKFGPEGVLRISGAFMTLGIALAVFLPSWTAVLAGFAIVGFGLANLVPVIFGAAGRLKGMGGAGPAIATVTTMGYLGFLSGPPVIGLIAAHAGLPVAFGTVVIFGVILATLGVVVLRGVSADEK